MYAMRDSDRRLLDRYKALGTPEEIEAKLRSPYPDENSGYAPLPLQDQLDEINRRLAEEAWNK